MATFIKFLIAMAIWAGVHYVCKDFPYDWLPIDKNELKPYDYFSFYSIIYMIAFLIIILIF